MIKEKGNSTHICSLSNFEEPKQSFGFSVIAFYISDHGFGHASRNIPIIRYILEAKSDVKIYIITGNKQGEFIKESLRDTNNYHNISFRFMKNTDLGLILKDNSLDIDKEKLNEEVIKYINSWDDRITSEKRFLTDKKVNLIVSDIVPWIFKCSQELDIQSVLISNFTWVDIYKEYLDKKICDEFRNCYKLASKVFLYNFYMDSMKEYINKYEEAGFVCREFNLDKVNLIKSKFNKPIVFVSVGRSVNLNSEIDVSNLNYNFIVTEGIKLIGDNVIYLPKETNNTQDYIKASDYVITKAGWGTIAECLIGKKKIAVLSRDSVAEDRWTIERLIRNKLAIKVDYNCINIKEIIRDLENFSPNYKEFNIKNDYKNIGDKLIDLL